MKIDWYRILPQYWFQHLSTDWTWDELLNDILDKVENIQVETYTTKLDGIEVWTSNWPYAYGTWYNQRAEASRMPSVNTRKRLKRVVEEAQREHLVNTVEKLRKK